MKFQSLTTSFCLIIAAVYSEVNSAWNPADITTTQVLPCDPRFTSLKNSVYHALSASWVSRDKAQLIMELIALTKPEVCVDIGSFIGSSALPMAATLKYLKNGKVYLIDAWSNQEAVKGISPQDPNYAWWSSLDMKEIKNQCLMMISKWSLENYCQVIHAPSEQACGRINSIDFLHLDGNFSKEGSLLDATLYLPKVKTGGYILLSNAFIFINGINTKIATTWFLYYDCELVAEIEGGNTLLFKKQ